MSSVESEGYAGDVSAHDAWIGLESDPRSILIDVRTQAEWTFVGLPALGGIGKTPVTVEWQSFPGMAVEPKFAEALGAALERAGVARDVSLFFLCRSGARSRAAAIAMTAAGWSRAYNVSGGFEGPPDAQGHRGRIDGWKAAGLPWTQS